jgi:WD40 repeat protein
MEVTWTRTCEAIHKKASVSVSLNPSGNAIASAGSDKLIAIHRLEDGVLLSKVENEHLAGINQVDWLNDHIVVSACDDGLIRIKNITENRLLRVFRLSNQAIPFCFTIHPINGIITVGDNTGAVTSFHLHHNEVVQHFDAHGKGVTAIRYSSDGSELVTGSQDGTIRQWAPDPHPVCFQTIVPCPHVFTGISSLHYSDDEKYLLVSTLDSTHRLFPRFLESSERRRDSSVLRSYKGHVNKRYALPTAILASFSLQRRCILSGCDKGKLHIWDLNSGELLLSFPAHQGAVHAIAVRNVLDDIETNIDTESTSIQELPSHQHEFIVITTGKDGTVKIWNFRPTLSASVCVNEELTVEQYGTLDITMSLSLESTNVHMDVDQQDQSS